MLNSIWNFLYKHFPNNYTIGKNYFKNNGNIFYIINDETSEKKYFPKICIAHTGKLSKFFN